MIHSHEDIIAKGLDVLICLSAITIRTLRGERVMPGALGFAHCMGCRRPSLLLFGGYSLESYSTNYRLTLPQLHLMHDPRAYRAWRDRADLANVRTHFAGLVDSFS